MERTIRLYESSTIAEKYSRHRWTAPEELFDKIFAFSARHGIGDDIAVDLACGPGQSTFPLCGRFSRTVGVDISKAQIAAALDKKRGLGVGDDVEFLVTSASDLPFADESVDLITCGVAWHFLDPNTVLPEIDRVLKRPGVLAVYCHYRSKILQRECDKLYSDFYHQKCTWQEGPYGNTRKVCENYYRDVKLPYPLAERYCVQLEATKSLEDLEEYVNSWDSYESYRKQNPGSTALEDMVLEMKKLLLEEGVRDEIAGNTQLKVCMSTPFFLLLAVKN